MGLISRVSSRTYRFSKSLRIDPKIDETRGSRPSLEKQSYLFWLTPHHSHESLRAEAGKRARRENARAPWILRGFSRGGRTVKTRANGARLPCQCVPNSASGLQGE